MASSCVSLGVVDGHVVVSASNLDLSATAAAIVGPDSSAPNARTLAFDLRSGTCVGRITNFSPVLMSSTQIAGEVDALLCVSNDSPGYVVDAAPMFTGVRVSSASPRSSNTVVPASSTDANTTQPALAPRLAAWSCASLAQSNGIEGDARLCDLVIHANLCDTSTGSSEMSVATAHGEGLSENPTDVISHSPIVADTTNRVDRFKRRVNRSGRLHQVRVQMTSVQSDNTHSEIPQMVMSFRETRRMT